MSADNQQERLSEYDAKCWYLAGFIEGEGSLCVSIKHQSNNRFGYLVDPEFSLYQHQSGISQLLLAKEIFGTGRINKKSGSPNVLVYSIVSLKSIQEKVLPFFEKYMIFSSKRKVFERFKEIVEAFERKEHLTPQGLIRIARKAYEMNPDSKGKKRKRTIEEISERILRDCTTDIPRNGMKIQSELNSDVESCTEMMQPT